MTDRGAEDEEPSLTLIVGPFSSPSFAVGLQELLADDFDLEVLAAPNALAAVRDRAAIGQVVVIIEGVDPAECRTYLAESACRCVVLFDPVGAKAFVGMDNPDWHRLADVIRAATDGAITDAAAVAEGRVHLVDLSRLVDDNGTEPDRGLAAGSLDPLVDWIELSLASAPSTPRWSTPC